MIRAGPDGVRHCYSRRVPVDDGTEAPADVAARESWERGRTRYPRLALTPEAFADYLRERFPDGLGDPAALPAEDLFLACACLDGVPNAAEELRNEYRASLASWVGRVTRSPAATAELADALLADLLVGEPDTGPRLAGYAGRGPLRAWLRMLAVRRSLNTARDAGRHARIENRVFAETVASTPDPEVGFIKARYGAEFETAFRDAMRDLAAGARALLRLHYGQELPLASLAAMHGWSKPTASRRLAAARAELLDGACALLRQRLHLDPAELESLFRVVRSQIDVSLSGLMRSSAR